jgi:hypothetical protein
VTAALSALVNPAGGLRYHGRALRHRARLWSRFARALACWLEEWEPQAPSLLLVGPSAGYCLPGAWLGRFAAIDVLEPDPLARLLLARRFPSLRGRLRFHAGDYLAPGADGFSVERPGALAAAFREHAILFCNVLGQLLVLYPEAVESPSFARWKAALAGAVAGREWASFHDRLSGPLAPGLPELGATAGAMSDGELVERFYAGASGPAELETHLTAGMFPAGPRRYLAWEVTPGWFQLIEAARA